MAKTILFITSCCFSDSQSNGKTLEELFSFYPKENLAQFYVKSFQPDWKFCNKYFKVTDKNMLKCFISRSGGELNPPRDISPQAKLQNGNRIKKDAFRLLVRQVLWNSNVWMRKTGFKTWVEKVKPDVVFYMVGENSFMMNIAMNVAKWRNIPIIVFNTEGYYFADNNYFASSSFLGTLCYPFFKRKYRDAYERLMEHTAYVLYSCPKLQKDYGAYFDIPSDILYTPSRIDVRDILIKEKTDDLVISYLGSLTPGRHKPLIEIGNFIHELNHCLKLRVFGRADDDVVNELQSAPGVDYKGPVPYAQVIKEIETSDILIHAENSDPFFQDLIRYGFSTKIADSLMSGRCFFVYAPEYVACYDYIKSINPDCVASNSQEMKEKLKALLQNPELRMKCIKNNKQYALLNHHPSINEKKINKVLETIVISNDR